MKVLILTCSMGEGHNSVARAIEEQFALRGCQAQTLDALQFTAKWLSRFLCSNHAFVYRNFPFLCKLTVPNEKHGKAQANGFMHWLAGWAGSMLREKLYEYIVANGFDTVISTHVYPAIVMTHINKNPKYTLRCRTAFVATDYSCAPLLEETDMDHYFIPHARLTEEFARRGLARSKIFPSGIPVDKRFFTKKDKAQARAELNLAEYAHMVLVMSGSMGAGPVEKLVLELQRTTDANTAVVVLCGHNDLMIRHIRQQCPDPRVLPLPFTRQVDTYMDACDLLISKAGGITCSETAQKGIPLLLVDGIPGWETINARFFSNMGMAKTFPRREIATAVGTAQALLSSPTEREALAHNQIAGIPRNPAGLICDVLLGRQ